MRKFWQSQKFKKLQSKWEEKLRASGFKDIEDEKNRLRQNAGNSYRTTTHVLIENKRRYYELLAQGYHQEKEFRDTVERIIILLRYRGLKIKDICYGLEAINERSHRDTVRKILRRYETRWKIRTKQ